MKIEKEEGKKTEMGNVQATARPGEGPGFLLWAVREV
jgi:hypothetical protein